MAAHGHCGFPWSQPDYLEAFSIEATSAHRDRKQDRWTDLFDVVESSGCTKRLFAHKAIGIQDIPSINYRSVRLLEKSDGAGDGYDQFLNTELELEIITLLPKGSISVR